MKRNFQSCSFLFIVLSAFVGQASAQTNELTDYRMVSSHTSYPDTGRVNGHRYNNTLFDAAGHYSDSSVMMLVPRGFRSRKKVDLIFWFHGWNNNIDTAILFYQLSSQFAASNRNAVLVLAETAKNAPDSYGGKLENPGVFRELAGDVLKRLKTEKVCRKCKPGNIVLAGHSGAYRVMAHILKNGKLPVVETVLFDALYANTNEYMNWIRQDRHHRFIDLYTDHGGTDGETRNMMRLLAKESLRYDSVEESTLTPQVIGDNRLLFIHSVRAHNDIINHPDNFLLFLVNNPFLKPLKPSL